MLVYKNEYFTPQTHITVFCDTDNSIAKYNDV